MPSNNTKDIVTKLLASLVFLGVQVYFPIKYISGRIEALPDWVLAFACWWGFTYTITLIWIKGSFPKWFAIISFVLFLGLSPMLDHTSDSAFMRFLASMANSWVNLAKSPALPAIGLGLGFLWLKKDRLAAKK